MDFRFTAEQQELREQARAFLDRRVPTADLARTVDSGDGWDVSSWGEIASLGWLGVSVEEADGGAGLSFLEEAILLEEFGRHLYPGPYLATIGMALPAVPGAQLGALVSGRMRWSTCMSDDAGLVANLQAVDRVVLEAGAELLVVEATGSPATSIDPSRRMGRLAPTVDREVLATGASARSLASAMSTRRLAALAAEAVGVAQQMLEWGLEHVREREQFGRKIGSYQAVSHPLVDSYVGIELARSLTYWAAWCISHDAVDRQRAAIAAYSAASEAAVFTCERVIQVHGGMGFIWESPLHRYYKRALWIQNFGGPARLHRAWLARDLIAGAAQTALETATPSDEGGSTP